MKYKIKITLLLLSLFLMTQFIGIYVSKYYLRENVSLPFGLETPKPETSSEYYTLLISIIFSFIIALLLFFLLIKFKIEAIFKIWFFLVTALAITISLNSFFSPLIKYSLILSIIFSVILSILKIYRKNFVVHNITEILIYPGIAAIFVSIFNIYTITVLLVLISFYDMWAVWHSGIMQKMAKYQINTLRVFSGFFVPYFTKGVKDKIKKWKLTLKKSELKKKKVKINVALLGGGDVVFPIITSGVMLKTFGVYSAIFVSLGATLGLAYLFLISEKKKFYPAMPFITIGIFIGILVHYLIAWF
ncbi:MAG: presenilin family intramembrane aspartyl protease [Candidatus Pacearchaeota archaeon]